MGKGVELINIRNILGVGWPYFSTVCFKLQLLWYRVLRRFIWWAASWLNSFQEWKFLKMQMCCARFEDFLECVLQSYWSQNFTALLRVPVGLKITPNQTTLHLLFPKKKRWQHHPPAPLKLQQLRCGIIRSVRMFHKIWQTFCSSLKMERISIYFHVLKRCRAWLIPIQERSRCRKHSALVYTGMAQWRVEVGGGVSLQPVHKGHSFSRLKLADMN